MDRINDNIYKTSFPGVLLALVMAIGLFGCASPSAKDGGQDLEQDKSPQQISGVPGKEKGVGKKSTKSLKEKELASLEYHRLDANSKKLLDVAFKGRSAEVAGLLKLGAKVNARSPKGETPVSIASFRGEAGMVKHFIQQGANVNIPDHQGQTPLMKASAAEHRDIVTLLLRAGAKVNDQDKTGTSALMFAALGKDDKIVESLIKSGAKVNLRNKKGQTALSLAEGFENAKVTQILVTNGGIR